MSQLADLMPSLSRLIKVSALGAISTIAVATAMMWLITGSTNPSAWLAAYEHARRCAVADAALNSQCTATVAQPAVSVQESPRPSGSPATAVPTPSPEDAPPPAASNPPAPPAAAVTTPAGGEEDDSGEGGDS